MSNDIKQIKLSSGDEIICETVTWSEKEGFIVKNVLKFSENDFFETDPDTGLNYSYYSLKNWMTGQFDPASIVVINPVAVVGIMTPPEIVVSQYRDMLVEISAGMEEIKKIQKEEEEGKKPKLKPSAKGNVISFPTE